MATMKMRSNLKVAVFVAGPREVDRDAQLCQALLIERELAKVAHVTILGEQKLLFCFLSSHLYYSAETNAIQTNF